MPNMTTARNGEAAASEADGSRYNFEIDVDSQSTHAKVVRLVGCQKRVLELGCATGYMTRVFRDHDCRVVGVELDAAMAAHAEAYCDRLIVGDLDQLDLAVELGDDRFDVVVAADVLEHLKDPWAVLRSLKAYIRPDGYLVASLPNIAHGSVRLALLEGHFPYSKLGLLDSTHLRFFTLESLTRLFEESDFVITHLERQELMIDRSEISFKKDNVPPELFSSLESDPESRTYQYLVVAHPLPAEGMDWLKQHLRSLAEQRQVAERARAEQRQALAAVNERQADVIRQLDMLTVLERQLRAELLDAHDQLLRRDEEFGATVRDLVAQRDNLAAERDRLEAQCRDLAAGSDNLAAYCARLEARLAQIRRSLPGRVIRGTKRILTLGQR